MQKEWTITQLENQLPQSLAYCHTDFERSMVRTIHGKEVRELAEKLSQQRKLTPGEIAIASQYGYR